MGLFKYRAAELRTLNSESPMPSKFSDWRQLNSLILQCRSTPELTQLHALCIHLGHLPLSLPLTSSLLLSYASLHHLPSSLSLFHLSPLTPLSAFLWNSLSRGLSACNLHNISLGVYNAMVRANVRPDERSVAFGLTAAARAGRIYKGQEMHATAVKLGFLNHVFVGNTLLNFYGSCGIVESARKVFDGMPERDIVTWNSIVSVFADRGLYSEALEWFLGMIRSGIAVNSVSLLSVVPVSGKEREEGFGMGVHGLGIKTGLDNVLPVGNSLVNMYGSFGRIDASIKLFKSLPGKNEVSWNSIIGCLVHVELYKDALNMFQEMLNHGFLPSSVTLTSFVPALVELGCSDLGKEIHAYGLRRGMCSDVYLANSLIDMYAKFGCSEKATYIFETMDNPNIVSWNSMIYNYAQNKSEVDALSLVREMVVSRVVPNSVTFVNLLPACARIGSCKRGKELHALSVRNGAIFDLFVSNAFIDMYVKCGRIDLARRVFDSSKRDDVSYNTVIMGYSQSQFCTEALNLFIEMREVGLNYDKISFMGALSACANLAALKKGKEIHCQVIKNSLSNHLFITNLLLDLYAKTGRIRIATRIFQRISRRDVSSWNSLMLVYGQYGEINTVLKLFDEMPSDDISYDQVSYIAVLSACAHGGLVNQGKHYFSKMLQDKNIKPTSSHYACLVDLISRAGRLAEAEELIKNMPFEPGSDVWGTLLGACRIHGDVEMATRAAAHLFEYNNGDSGYYAVLSNVYAEVGRWKEANEIRRFMKGRKVVKNPGFSWVQSENGVNMLVSGELIDFPGDEIVC